MSLIITTFGFRPQPVTSLPIRGRPLIVARGRFLGSSVLSTHAWMQSHNLHKQSTRSPNLWASLTDDIYLAWRCKKPFYTSHLTKNDSPTDNLDLFRRRNFLTSMWSKYTSLWGGDVYLICSRANLRKRRDPLIQPLVSWHSLGDISTSDLGLGSHEFFTKPLCTCTDLGLRRMGGSEISLHVNKEIILEIPLSTRQQGDFLMRSKT
jgi:hypothetical protein